MYVVISVILIILFILGMAADYVSTIRERNLNSKNKKIVKLQMALAKGQRILNGRTILPLTVLSSILCLKRSRSALRGLIRLEPTENRQTALIDVNKKLASFAELEPTLPFFYASLAIPTVGEELVAILKHAMTLVIVLKVEHAKGEVSVEDLNAEVAQLEILVVRLKSAIYSLQAMQKIEMKEYPQAQSLSDKAMELLLNITCENDAVANLVDTEIEKVKLINVGISGVIEEKNHTFYDKFKGQEDTSNTLVNELDDGLDGVFGDKRKY